MITPDLLKQATPQKKELTKEEKEMITEKLKNCNIFQLRNF